VKRIYYSKHDVERECLFRALVVLWHGLSTTYLHAIENILIFFIFGQIKSQKKEKRQMEWILKPFDAYHVFSYAVVYHTSTGVVIRVSVCWMWEFRYINTKFACVILKEHHAIKLKGTEGAAVFDDEREDRRLGDE